MSTAQLVTHGDASFANMESSKSQCGVIVFLTHEPGRSWHGKFQLGHLVHWTSNTIKRVLRSALAGEARSVSETVEEARWLRSVLAEMWPSVPCSSTLSEDSGSGFLAPTKCDTLRFLSLCQAVKSDNGTGSDTQLRIVTRDTPLRADNPPVKIQHSSKQHTANH